MIDRVLQYVLSQRKDVGQAHLEDLAICTAWCNSTEASSRERDDVAGIVETWRAAPTAEIAPTQGRRLQVLLRLLIEQLSSRGLDGLSRDEIEFLGIAADLARTTGDLRCARLSELIAPHRDSIRERRQAEEPSPGLKMLETRVRVVLPEHLLQSPRRQVALYAGQTLSMIGPTLETEGPLRVLGSIPDDCTLIVTGGPCAVDGYVLGRLGVSGGCDIRENIAGSVVAGAGDVRCRSIIHTALAVAKTGSVLFTNAMRPVAVFAGKGIVAAESIACGKFFGANITVEKCVQGGEIHVSGSLSAGEFLPSETCPLSIVLRTELSLQDYGEQLGPEVLRLKGRVARIKRQLAYLENMSRTAHVEAEHAASTAILEAFADMRLRGVLEERVQVARRLAVLNRVIGTLHGLYAGAAASLSFEQPPDEDMAGGLNLAEMESDLDDLAGDDSLDGKNRAERSEVRRIYERLGRVRNDRAAMLGVLTQSRDHLEGWIVERRQLNDKLESLNRHVARSMPDTGLDSIAQEADGAPGPTLAAIQRKLLVIREKPLNAEMQRRLQGPLFQLMITMMERRMQRLEDLASRAKDCQAELAKVTEELAVRHHVFVSGESGMRPPRVTGHFARDVRIYRDAYLLDEPDLVPGAVLMTPESTNAVVTYSRGLAGIIKVD